MSKWLDNLFTGRDHSPVILLLVEKDAHDSPKEKLFKGEKCDIDLIEKTFPEYEIHILDHDVDFKIDE